MTIRWPSWESSTMKPGREDPVWSDSSLGIERRRVGEGVGAMNRGREEKKI